MKKKMVKRLMAASVAGTLAVTMFAGCGGSSDSKDSSAKTEDTGEDNSDKPDTWIADRTITVQAYVDDIGNTLPKDFNNTETMKKITELTGIKLDVKYTPGDSDAKVLASQLASGTIPDVIVSYLDNSTRPEFPLLYKAAKDGMFADVSEYMKNSEVYSKYYEDDYLPDDTKNNIVFRDDLDGVYLWQMNIDEIDRSLEYDADEEYVGGMYIQKAIADDLGIDTTAINTQEDFYDLLVKIKEGGYTDDNGNAVYPLGPKYWGGSVDALKYIATGYDWGVSDDYNLDENGDVKHIAETDHVYDEINFVRKLLDEDLMNPEFFTMDSTRAEEVSKNHNSAIIADVHNYEEIIYSNDDWIPLGPLNDIADDNKEVVHGKSGRGCMAISADAENPMAQSMKTMTTTMPLFSAFICITMPAGLGIYWIATSVVTIIQQLIVNAYMDKVNIDDMIAKNLEKVNKKRAKQGLPPAKVTQNATASLKAIKAEEEKEKAAEEVKKEKIAKQIEESSKYYNTNAKPGSLASKAAMVQKYNEAHDKRK